MDADTLARLYSGELPPRIGDFIGSQVSWKTCGIVIGIERAGTKANPLAAYRVRLGNGSETSILGNDVRFIAPGEE